MNKNNHRDSKDILFRRKSAIIYLSISLHMCLSAQKNRFTEMDLLSTHNICFAMRN